MPEIVEFGRVNPIEAEGKIEFGRENPLASSRPALSFFGGANESIATALGIPVDLVNAVLRMAGSRQERPFGGSEQIKGGMRALGLQQQPLAGTPGERIMGEAGRGAGYGAFFGPIGAVAGAAGGLGAGVAKEAGGGLLAELGAGLAGGIAGGGAAGAASKTARAVIGARGTPRLEALRAEEVTPRIVGDVTGSQIAKQTTAFLQNAPVTGGLVQRAAQRTTDEIAAAVERRARSYGQGATPTEAGEAIEAGVKTFAGRVSATANKLYERLHRFIPKNTPVSVTETERIVGELTATMEGLGKTAETLTPSLFRNLADDIAENKDVTFGALSRLRTEVGKRLGDPMLMDDIGRADSKRLYGALTADLRKTAATISDRALREFDRTNEFYSKQMQFIESAFDKFNKAGASPETFFTWALAEGKTGATRLAALRKAMGREEFGVVSAVVLRRMGTGGKDIPFDTNIFLREWEKIRPEAKAELFSGPGWEGYALSVDRLASIARDFRATGRLANTSRTAGTAQLLTWLGGLGAAATGGPTGVLEAAVGGATMTAGLSKLLTSPAFARWLATPVGEARLPAHVTALIGVAAKAPEISDEISALAAFIGAQFPPAIAIGSQPQSAIAPSPARRMP